MVHFVFLLTSLLMTGYVALLLIYRKHWKSIPDFFDDTNQSSVFISVIVPARNEEKNITALLNSIRNQSYPATMFEVLVVDDFSTDNTTALVKRFEAENIKLIALKDYINPNSINSYKKKAIETGIQLSRGELIVTTDADCILNPKWLSTIASFYEKYHPIMIVMPVSIHPVKSWIQHFQSLDFMCLQGITGAAVSNNFHGMCNGANLAYTKKGFEEVDGFAGIDNIASGDDMMLMHKFAARNKSAIKYLKSENVIVETLPVSTIREFIHQRVRWASKADKYQDKSLFPVLLLVYLINFFLLILFGLAMFIDYNTINLIFLLGLFFLKTITEFYFLVPVASFFKKQKMLWGFPFLQPIHIVYIIIVGGFGKFGSYQWKGRKVK